jgi:hypothetical protein
MGEMQGGEGRVVKWSSIRWKSDGETDGGLREHGVLARASWNAPSKLRVNPWCARTGRCGLFVAEGYQGVYANGAAGWDVAGGKGNDEK